MLYENAIMCIGGRIIIRWIADPYVMEWNQSVGSGVMEWNMVSGI